jgi:ABC-type sugar transport system substrate-binding protein
MTYQPDLDTDLDELSEEERREFSRSELLKLGAAVGGGLGALPLLAGSAAAAPRRAAATAAQPKVIFVVHDNNPFFVPVRVGFERFGKMAGWKTQWVGPPKQDTQDTVNLQANALTAKPAGVIFTRIDTSSFDANIRRAQQLGIKIILSNVASAGYQKLGVGFVGQDFVPAGRVHGQQAAKWAQKLTGRKSGLIVLGNFAPGNSALEQRIQGTKQGIAAYNRANGTNYTTDVLVTSSDQAEAIGRIDAKYRKDKDKIVGWAMSEFTNQFVANWARSKGLKSKFSNGGFDLIKPVLDAIKSGYSQWAIGQNPYAQGFIASALLSMELFPGYPGFTYDTGAEVVDNTNIDFVIKREKPFI